MYNTLVDNLWAIVFRKVVVIANQKHTDAMKRRKIEEDPIVSVCLSAVDMICVILNVHVLLIT